MHKKDLYGIFTGMATHIVIEKTNNENNASMLRRFIRKVRNAGFTRTVRNRRYFSRLPSKLRRKQSALVRIEKTQEYEKLYKLGKVN